MNDSLCTRLDDYLAGDLGEADRQEFKQHLDHCSFCAEEVRLQSAIDRVLAEASPQAPAELKRKVAASLRRRRVRRFARMTIAAGLLLACAAGGWRWWLAAQRQPVEPRWSQNDAPPPLPDRPAAPQQIVDRPPTPDEPPAFPVAVDAGSKAIVVARPSADPTVHIFWVYPTLDVSMNAPDETTDPSELKRNPL
jgi:anti-sigma factor (TIGR02949 family)